MTSLFPLLFLISIQSGFFVCEEDVRRFDLSGTYYHTKNLHQTKSGDYMLYNYAKVVEASLNEVDTTFADMENQIEYSNKLDLLELGMMVTLYITIAGIIFFIRSLCAKNNKLERNNMTMMPLIQSQNERANLKTMLAMMNSQAPGADDKMFIEI